MLLQVEIVRYGQYVLGKILKQDESLRGEDTIAKTSCMAIGSKAEPALWSDRLWIRGSYRDRDDSAFWHECEDEADAKDLVVQLKQAIAKVNESAPSIPPSASGNIECFVFPGEGGK